MKKLFALFVLIVAALGAAAEDVELFRLGVSGVVKTDLQDLQLYLNGAEVADPGLVLVEKVNGVDYALTGLPDVAAGSGDTYALSWTYDGINYVYTWPRSTVTPQTTSAVLSYQLPPHTILVPGSTLPSTDLTVAGLGADPLGAGVTFTLYDETGTAVLTDAPATLVASGAAGDGTWTATLRHEWTVGETTALAEGRYSGRFTVTFSGGDVIVLPPRQDELTVEVVP